ERTRACPGQRPAEAEHRATREIARAGAEHLWCEAEWLAIRTPNPEPFDRQERNCGGQHRRADDAVHVERIESEHLLDAEPCEHLVRRQSGQIVQPELMQRGGRMR